MTMRMLTLIAGVVIAEVAGATDQVGVPVATQFASPSMAATPSVLSGMGQSLFGLLVVLIAMGTVFWLLRRFNMVGPGSGAQLRVIQALSLGNKERAVLIEVDGARLLLGVSVGQVSLLKELPSATSRTDIGTDSSLPVDPTASTTPGKTEPLPGAPQFSEILRRSLGLATRGKS